MAALGGVDWRAGLEAPDMAWDRRGRPSNGRANGCARRGIRELGDGTESRASGTATPTRRLLMPHPGRADIDGTSLSA